MKLQILTKTIPAVALLLTMIASPVYADDHNYDRHRRDSRHHRRGSRGVNIELAIPGVAVDVYSPRRERVIIVEHNRRYYNGNRVEFEVQRGLARYGYYRGPIDGDVGYGTRSAIRAYQLDFGLVPTGYIDSELLVSLQLR